MMHNDSGRWKIIYKVGSVCIAGQRHTNEQWREAGDSMYNERLISQPATILFMWHVCVQQCKLVRMNILKMITKEYHMMHRESGRWKSIYKVRSVCIAGQKRTNEQWWDWRLNVQWEVDIETCSCSHIVHVVCMCPTMQTCQNEYIENDYYEMLNDTQWFRQMKNHLQG